MFACRPDDAPSHPRSSRVSRGAAFAHAPGAAYSRARHSLSLICAASSHALGVAPSRPPHLPTHSASARSKGHTFACVPSVAPSRRFPCHVITHCDGATRTSSSSMSTPRDTRGLFVFPRSFLGGGTTRELAAACAHFVMRAHDCATISISFIYSSQRREVRRV